MKSYNERVTRNVLRYESNIFGIEYRRFMLIILTIIVSALLFNLNLYISVIFLLVSSVLILGRIHGEVLGTITWRWLKHVLSKSEVVVINSYDMHEINDCIIAYYENEAAGILEIGSEQFHSIPPGDLKSVDESTRLLLNKIECNIEFISIPRSLDLTSYLPGKKGDLENDYAELLKYAFRDAYYFNSYAVLHYPSGNTGFQNAALKVVEEMDRLRRNITAIGFSVRKISSKREFEEIFSGIV
ncbi:hypothetical protein OXIME_000872 [Oxyplasma meridianum]|uniref:Uncharacterized protein n=1 Tax=Oxyplasma meridianum TaxID=3073602 RepID=A0AAX4NHS3_9ARCH